MKKYIAEFIGACALSLIVALSVTAVFPVATPILAGLTLGLFVYIIGSISGCHINPAVTIGLWSIGEVKVKDAVGYVVAQLLGGGLTLFIVTKLGRSLESVPTYDSWMMVAELVGNFFFAMGIAAVVYKKVPSSLSGVVIGSSLFLGVAFAALIGAPGFLNPAVALGANAFTLTFIIGPIIGSVLGFQAYKHLQK